MNRLIDLMPAASSARLRGKSAGRRWLIAYVATGAGSLLCAFGFRVKQVAAGRELTRLEAELAADNDYSRQVTEIAGAIDRRQTEIVRFSRLAWPVELSDVIGVIAEVVPESVALTAITIVPKMEAERIGQNDGPTSAESLTIELTGVAPSDLDVAGLIAGLEERGLFNRVAMDHTRESAAGAGTREFGLTAEIDLVSRRRPGTERPPPEASK